MTTVKNWCWVLGALVFALDASAKTRLPVVLDYNKSADQTLWKSYERSGNVPEDLVKEVTVENPSRAFQAPYRSVFLQNERLVVCNVDCLEKQNLVPVGNNDDMRVVRKNNKTKLNQSLIRQATVYYWVNRLFDRMSELGYAPTQRLVVNVDREIPNVQTGVDETNNAFFNEKDWSLSFLPTGKLGPIASLIAGKPVLPSAFDPSVAMHEATHSVFESLIGPILNAEIFGLHEAFADYFALTTLESPIIGRVMLKGKGIRDAQADRRYSPGMESHDLGNVVLAVLWKNRDLILSKDVADKAALDAIKFVSRNPYAVAADVVNAYSVALENASPGIISKDPAFEAAVRKNWSDVGLAPVSDVVDLSPIAAPVDASAAVQVSLELRVPGKLADEYGLPPLQQVSVKLIETREVKDTSLRWTLVSVVNAADQAPIWVLQDTLLNVILGAYTPQGERVSRESSDAYKQLLEIGSNLGEVLGWTHSYAEEFRTLYQNKFSLMRLFLKRGHDKVTPTFFTFNGKIVEGTVHSARMKPALLGWLAGAVLGNEMRVSLGSFKRLEFYTVPTASLENRALPELFPGETVLGYRVRFRTGVETSIMTEAAGPAFVVGGPVAPQELAESLF